MKYPHIKGSFYVDDRLLRELKWGVQLCKEEDDDFVLVIDGPEGAGKSMLARQIAYVCSAELGCAWNIDYIHFDSQDYMEKAESDNQKCVNLLDESRSSLNKKRTMSRGNTNFTNWFSECRDKNQVHILVLPAVHDLDNYITLWRMKLVINVMKYRKENKDRYSGFDLVRGSYKIFSPGEMQYYIQNQRRIGRYKYPPRAPQNWLKFNNFEVLTDTAAYKEKKAKFRQAKQEKEQNAQKNPIEDLLLSQLY